MRLWHKDLIALLPPELLTSQWRELCLIAKAIGEKGTPGNSAVNKIMDYDISHFLTYCKKICNEMHAREYTCKLDSIIPKWFKDTPEVSDNDLFKDWHTDRYLKQCYYALEEKYDNGSLSDEELAKIREVCGRCFEDEIKNINSVVLDTSSNKVSVEQLKKLLLMHPQSLTLKL